MATSKKVTELPALLTVTGDDLLYIVNDPLGTPSSLKVTTKTFLESNVTANASFDGHVSGLTFKFAYSATPANASAVPAGFTSGTAWSDGNYLYVVAPGNTLKRAALASW